MIKLENTLAPSDSIWEAVIRGMRNPMNSWDKSDSRWSCGIFDNLDDIEFKIGPNDKKLMHKLCKAGKDHRKFMRMLPVYVDIIAPLYWWKEFDTYKIGTVANSCSTMHKIAEKEFTFEDFSYEHLKGESDTEWGDYNAEGVLEATIFALNKFRKSYIESKNKDDWWQLIQLLPSSYNQRRMVMLNYEVLSNIYHARKDHKLDEWHVFCDWIKTLPMTELITGVWIEGADCAKIGVNIALLDRRNNFIDQCHRCAMEPCPSSCSFCDAHQDGLCACLNPPEPDETSCKYYKER